MTADAAETALDREVVDLEPAHSDTAADEADRAARRRSFQQGQAHFELKEGERGHHR